MSFFHPVLLFGLVCLLFFQNVPPRTFIWTCTFIRHLRVIPKTSTNLYCVDIWKGLVSQPDVYSLAYSITTVKSYSSYNSHEWRGYFPSFPEQKILSGALTAVNVPCYYLWSTCHRVEHFFHHLLQEIVFQRHFFHAMDIHFLVNL